MKSGIRSSRIRQAHSGASLTSILAIAALTTIWATPAQAADDEPQATAEAEQDTRNTIVVTGNQTPSKAAKAALRDIPGAGAIIDSREAERGRNASLEDLLAFQPGVFAQAADGTGAVKISIRGSGVQTSPGYFREGIKFLYDGLPLTGPGGTPDEMLNGIAVNFTEVLYGANAFKYSAVTLGGAINYSTHTGYSAPGLRASLSAGSFANRRAQGSFGGVSGNADFYIAASRDLRDGFREGTYNGNPISNYGRGTDLIGNFGLKVTPAFDIRLTARFRREYYVGGTTLTRAQLEQDPTQLRVISGRKKKGSYLVGLTAGYTFEDASRLEAGIGYSHYPHINAWKYSARPAYWNWTDWTGTLRYNRTGDTVFGLKSNTTFSLSGTYNDFGEAKTYVAATGDLFNHLRYTGSYDAVASIGNDLQLADGAHETWLTTGLTWTKIRRNVRVPYSSPTNPNNTPFGTAVDRSDTAWAPRVGIRHQLIPALQVVANVSRSIDPPSSWGLAGSSSAYVRDLKPQRATTFEGGLRLDTGNGIDGSLTLYRAYVNDELLTIVLAQATETTDAVVTKANASKTIHQGVEAGLTATLWKNEGGDNLVLRQSYTFNDFYYRDDQEFGNNQLPGLPRHTYQAELQYQLAAGFYIGGSARVASSYYVDYGNTVKAPSYAIFGLRAGYEDPKDRFKIYFDVRNITDKTYVSATSPQYNLAGVDTNVFYPGDGISAFTGISFNF